jgi:hypothetical protein
MSADFFWSLLFLGAFHPARLRITPAGRHILMVSAVSNNELRQTALVIVG